MSAAATRTSDDLDGVVFAIDKGLTRDGLVQVRRRWAPADGSIATLLLIHGLAEHGGRYHHVGRRLARRGIDVVALDLRGFGLSGGPRAHLDSMDRMLDDVEDQLAELRPLGRPMVLLGHSMGGLICSNYAASGRPMTDLLVLSGPALNADVPTWQTVLAPVLGRLTPRLPIPSEIDGDILSTDPSVGEAYEADPLVTSAVTAGLGRALFESMQWTLEHLQRIVVPTYIVHGSDDVLVPPSASEPFEQLPVVERHVLKGMRHEVFNEPDGLTIVDGVADWIHDHLGPKTT